MEYEGETFRFGSNHDLTRVEESPALDEVEHVAHWASEQANQTVANRAISEFMEKNGPLVEKIEDALKDRGADYDPPKMEDPDGQA